MKKIIFSLAALSVAAVIFLSACRTAPTGEQDMGQLTGIRYNQQIGMVRCDDFYIDICENEIKSTRYFPINKEATDYIIAESLPFEDSKWQELKAMAEELLPRLTPVKKREPSPFSWLAQRLAEPSDGPNSEEFYLIFEYGEPVQYKIPNDAAFRELIKQLKELSYEAVGK